MVLLTDGDNGNSSISVPAITQKLKNACSQKGGRGKANELSGLITISAGVSGMCIQSVFCLKNPKNRELQFTAVLYHNAVL